MTFKQIVARIKGASLKERITFTKNLALIIKAGMPLPQGLTMLSGQAQSPLLKEALSEVVGAVNKGKNFSEALEAYPSLFNDFYISMVKTGEVGGTLENVLNDLTRHMEKEHALRSRVLGALMYPLIILSVMVVVAIVMMIFVVPQLSKVFKDFHVELPLMTRVMIGASNVVANYSVLVIGGLCSFIFALWYVSMKTKQGKRVFAWLFLHAPLVGALVKKINTARIARSLQTLIQAGLGIVQALSVTSGLVKNVYYKEALYTTGKEVEKGKTLHEILATFPSLFSPLMVQLIAVGEETGSIDVVLEQLAASYEEDVDVITKNLPSMIEPILMVFIGSSVGFFAISMLQPIYAITSSIH